MVPFAAGQLDRDGPGGAEELAVADMVAFVKVGKILEGAGMAVAVTVVTPEIMLLVLVYSAWSWPEMVRVCSKPISQDVAEFDFKDSRRSKSPEQYQPQG